MPAPPDEADRLKILTLIEAGLTNKAIMKATGKSRATVQRVRARARASNKPDEAMTRKKGQGRKASIVIKANVDKIRKRMVRNPYKLISAHAKDLGMSPTSTKRLVAAAGFKSMARLVVHDIMPGQEAKRKARAQLLLNWKAANPNKVIVWTDEKLFVAESHHNRQNDRALVNLRAYDPTVQLLKRRKNPTSIMVFATMASEGIVMDPIIFPAGSKINSASIRTLSSQRLLPG